MIKLLYGIAILLIVSWVVGFFGFHAGNWVHLLLVIGMIVLLVNIIIEG
jgi:hypothetical protein